MTDNGLDKRELYIRWILSKRFRKAAKELDDLYHEYHSFWNKCDELRERARRYLGIAKSLEDPERPIEEIYV